MLIKDMMGVKVRTWGKFPYREFPNNFTRPEAGNAGAKYANY